LSLSKKPKKELEKQGNKRNKKPEQDLNKIFSYLFSFNVPP
jgi:hypothetical protein